MSTSFIVNPEVRLIVSSKSLPNKKKSNGGIASHESVAAQVKFTERELELLRKVNELKLEKSTTKDSKKERTSKKDKTTSLTLNEVKAIKKELGDSSFLCDVIDKAELKLPENEIVERNPVLEKRIQRLKAQQEQRVYNSMTKNVDTSRKHIPDETISFQCKCKPCKSGDFKLTPISL